MLPLQEQNRVFEEGGCVNKDRVTVRTTVPEDPLFGLFLVIFGIAMATAYIVTSGFKGSLLLTLAILGLSATLVLGGLFLRYARSSIEYDPVRQRLVSTSSFILYTTTGECPSTWFSAVTVRKVNFGYSRSFNKPYDAWEVLLTGPGEALFGLEPRLLLKEGALREARRYASCLELPLNDCSGRPSAFLYPPWGGLPPGKCQPPKQILPLLMDALSALVAILEKDKACQWTAHFRSALARARELQNSKVTPGDLNELSSSITYVYGGAGSFGDYSPGTYDPGTGRMAVIPGTGTFSKASERVFEVATDLRSVRDPK